MPNPNENCLSGKRCPKCGSYSHFEVVATSVFDVYDSGTDSHRDVEFDGDSIAYCSACHHSATWKEFNDPECKEEVKSDGDAKAGA